MPFFPESAPPESAPPGSVPSHTAPKRSWFRRRPGRVLLAGLTATGIAVGGVLVYTTASATGEPAAHVASTPVQAVRQALEGLGNEPISVTVTEDGRKDSFTLTRTPQGAGFAVSGSDASVEAALVDERLYLKVEAKESQGVRSNPMAAMLLAGHPSIGALLDGKWVSVDVSPDSRVLAALAQAQMGSPGSPDSHAPQAAAKHLAETLHSIGRGLAEPLRQAMTDHATITPIPEAAPSDGSQHYRVEVPLDGVRADVSEELQSAGRDLLAAWDEFMGDAGSGLTTSAPHLSDVHDRVESALDKGLSEDLEPVTADVYVTGGRLTRIEVDGTTLAFAADPSLAAVPGAVSLDDDLVALLPLLSRLGSMGASLDGAAPPGLALAPRA